MAEENNGNNSSGFRNSNRRERSATLNNIGFNRSTHNFNNFFERNQRLILDNLNYVIREELSRLDCFAKFDVAGRPNKIFIAGGMAHLMHRDMLGINSNNLSRTHDIDVYCIVIEDDLTPIEEVLNKCLTNLFEEESFRRHCQLFTAEEINTRIFTHESMMFGIKKYNKYTKYGKSITYSAQIKINGNIGTIYDFVIYKNSETSPLIKNIEMLDESSEFPLIPLNNLCELSIHALFCRCIESIKYGPDSKQYKKCKQDFRRLNKLFMSQQMLLEYQDPMFNELHKLFYALISADILPFKTSLNYSRKIQDYLGVEQNINQSINEFLTSSERTHLSRDYVKQYFGKEPVLINSPNNVLQKNNHGEIIIDKYIALAPLFIPLLIFKIRDKLR